MNQTEEQRERLRVAVTMAMLAHDDQWRKGGLPYISHPMQVMSTVSAWGIDDTDIWIAALLHDTVEDTSLSHEKIDGVFGTFVSSVVRELTFVPGGELSKEQYLDSFKSRSLPALVIKVADRICNVRDFLATDRAYAPKYFHKAGALFAAMSQRRTEIAANFSKQTFNQLYSDYKSVLNAIYVIEGAVA